MFKIGQKVVCVKTHSRGVVVKGKIYTIVSSPIIVDCGCIVVDVGIMGLPGTTKCVLHNSITSNPSGSYLLSSRLFRPLSYSNNSAKEIIEKFSPLEERVDVEIKKEEEAI